MRQTAPDPELLFDLVSKLTYRPGWTFDIEDLERDQDHGRGVAGGLTLIITTRTSNSYHPSICESCRSVVTDYRVHHYFIVPAATYDQRSWQRWLLDQVIRVESHEACEFFEVDGDRPYAPHHGPGNDPYIIFEQGSSTDARTSFRGDVKDAESPIPEEGSP